VNHRSTKGAHCRPANHVNGREWQQRFAIDNQPRNGDIGFEVNRRFRHILRRKRGAELSLLLVAALSICPTAGAEDLKTNSGRVYRNAAILRAEKDGWVITHKFGVVKIPLGDISPEAKRKFDPARALEAARQARAQQQQQAAERAREHAEQIAEQKALVQKAAVDVDERNQEEAEELEARIQRGQTKGPQAPRRYRLRGEVIGVGPDWVLVLCEPAGGVSRVKEELARLRDSPFSPPTPALKEVLVVTGARHSLGEGDEVDLPVAAAGTKSDFRTRSGDIYSGRYRVFRALE
jgi:hypothetical protein